MSCAPFTEAEKQRLALAVHDFANIPDAKARFARIKDAVGNGRTARDCASYVREHQDELKVIFEVLQAEKVADEEERQREEERSRKKKSLEERGGRENREQAAQQREDNQKRAERRELEKRVRDEKKAKENREQEMLLEQEKILRQIEADNMARRNKEDRERREREEWERTETAQNRAERAKVEQREQVKRAKEEKLARDAAEVLANIRASGAAGRAGPAAQFGTRGSEDSSSSSDEDEEMEDSRGFQQDAQLQSLIRDGGGARSGSAFSLDVSGARRGGGGAAMNTGGKTKKEQLRAQRLAGGSGMGAEQQFNYAPAIRGQMNGPQRLPDENRGGRVSDLQALVRSAAPPGTVFNDDLPQHPGGISGGPSSSSSTSTNSVRGRNDRSASALVPAAAAPPAPVNNMDSSPDTTTVGGFGLKPVSSLSSLEQYAGMPLPERKKLPKKRKGSASAVAGGNKNVGGKRGTGRAADGEDSDSQSSSSDSSYVSSDSDEEDWRKELKECLLCCGDYESRGFVAAYPCGHYGVCAVCCLKQRHLRGDKKCPTCMKEPTLADVEGTDCVLLTTKIERRFDNFKFRVEPSGGEVFTTSNLIKKDPILDVFVQITDSSREFGVLERLRAVVQSFSYCPLGNCGFTCRPGLGFEEARKELAEHLEMRHGPGQIVKSEEVAALVAKTEMSLWGSMVNGGKGGAGGKPDKGKGKKGKNVSLTPTEQKRVDIELAKTICHPVNAHPPTLCAVCVRNSTEFPAFLPRYKNLDEHLKKKHTDCGFCKTGYEYCSRRAEREYLPNPYAYGGGETGIARKGIAGQIYRGQYYAKLDALKHLREQHEKCFHCEKHGLSEIWFDGYDQLWWHFEGLHYVCQHDQCYSKKHQNIFATLHDKQVHDHEVHKGPKPTAPKDEEGLPGGPPPGGSSGASSPFAPIGPADARAAARARAAGGPGGASSSSADVVHQRIIYQAAEENFPSLAMGAAPTVKARPKVKQPQANAPEFVIVGGKKVPKGGPSRRVAHQAKGWSAGGGEEEDDPFPPLGGGAGGGAASSNNPTPSGAGGKKKKKTHKEVQSMAFKRM